MRLPQKRAPDPCAVNAATKIALRAGVSRAGGSRAIPAFAEKPRPPSHKDPGWRLARRPQRPWQARENLRKANLAIGERLFP
jgi:hypothetical protein